MDLSIFLSLLRVLDVYLKIVLTSWPAVVMIVSLLIIFRHKKSLDRFIENIKKFGPVEAYPQKPQKENESELASLKDILQKRDTEFRQQVKKSYFERIYGYLYGGQLEILDKISTSSKNKITFSEAFDIYNQRVAEFPLLASYSVYGYVSYLKNLKLTFEVHENNTDYVSLTDYGKEFVDFLKKEGLSFQKIF